MQQFTWTNQALMFYNWIQVQLTYRMNFESNKEPPIKTITKKKKKHHLENLHKARGIHFATILNNVSRWDKVKKQTKPQHSNLKVLFYKLPCQIIIHSKTFQNFFIQMSWVVCRCYLSPHTQIMTLQKDKLRQRIQGSHWWSNIETVSELKAVSHFGVWGKISQTWELLALNSFTVKNTSKTSTTVCTCLWEDLPS